MNIKAIAQSLTDKPKVIRVFSEISEFEHHLTEYRTFDEGACSAEFFSCDKTTTPDPFIAFTSLYFISLHHYEEWPLDQTQAEDLNHIYDSWLLQEQAEWTIQLLKPDLAYEKIAYFMDIIQAAIHRRRPESGSFQNPEYWGIFKDGKRSPRTQFNQWKDLEIITAVSLRDNWNCQEIFYETALSYTFVYWSTGA